MSENKSNIVKKPWVVYPGSTIQQNYAEDESHGYILWDIKSKNNFDVKYHELENETPFVTIFWDGNLERFQQRCTRIKNRSRIRVVSKQFVSQTDLQIIKKFIREYKNPSELTFKIESKIFNNGIISTSSGKKLEKSDISSYSNIIQLLKDFELNNKSFNFSEENWKKIESYTKEYVQGLNLESNFKKTWEINKLNFSNLFAYGEDNEINFNKLNGIVGILGNNRIGKSSIIGSILYCLFNASDRGPLKNINFVNTRKKMGEATITMFADGKDYLISRRTTKVEKKGVVSATTNVTLFELNGDEIIELNGEQRNETDKFIRSMIGTCDNFLLTSFSSQADINRFINEGSTHRKQILTKFLGLDIFEKLAEASKEKLSISKLQLKDLEAQKIDSNIDLTNRKIEEETVKLQSCLRLIEAGNLKLKEFDSSISKFDENKQIEFSRVKQLIQKNIEEIKKTENNISLLREKKEASIQLLENLKSYLSSIEEETIIKHKQANEIANNLKIKNIQLKNIDDDLLKKINSTSILSDIPCGVSYQNSCKFIKNAFEDRLKISGLEKEKTNIIDEINELLEQSKLFDKEQLDKTIEIQKNVSEQITNLYKSIAKLESDISNSENLLDVLNQDLKINFSLKDKMLSDFGFSEEELEDIFIKSDEMSQKRNKLNWMLQEKEKEKLEININIAILNEQLKNLNEKIVLRNQILSENRINEFLFNAFSKNGISAKIIKEQLPVINQEIQNILSDVVDFTVELQMEGDYLEVYISYGDDNKRLIEMCSGMEKFISSLAIRVSLTNISTLPKTNILILDEGFGTLDDEGIESCNKLLISLKKYFKSILVITHIDAIKEIVDTIIDINKIGLDSKVEFK